MASVSNNIFTCNAKLRLYGADLVLYGADPGLRGLTIRLYGADLVLYGAAPGLRGLNICTNVQFLVTCTKETVRGHSLTS